MVLLEAQDLAMVGEQVLFVCFLHQQKVSPPSNTVSCHNVESIIPHICLDWLCSSGSHQMFCFLQMETVFLEV